MTTPNPDKVGICGWCPDPNNPDPARHPNGGSEHVPLPSDFAEMDRDRHVDRETVEKSQLPPNLKALVDPEVQKIGQDLFGLDQAAAVASDQQDSGAGSSTPQLKKYVVDHFRQIGIDVACDLDLTLIDDVALIVSVGGKKVELPIAHIRGSSNWFKLITDAVFRCLAARSEIHIAVDPKHSAEENRAAQGETIGQLHDTIRRLARMLKESFGHGQVYGTLDVDGVKTRYAIYPDPAGKQACSPQRIDRTRKQLIAAIRGLLDRQEFCDDSMTFREAYPDDIKAAEAAIDEARKEAADDERFFQLLAHRSKELAPDYPDSGRTDPFGALAAITTSLEGTDAANFDLTRTLAAILQVFGIQGEEFYDYVMDPKPEKSALMSELLSESAIEWNGIETQIMKILVDGAQRTLAPRLIENITIYRVRAMLQKLLEGCLMALAGGFKNSQRELRATVSALTPEYEKLFPDHPLNPFTAAEGYAAEQQRIVRAPGLRETIEQLTTPMPWRVVDASGQVLVDAESHDPIEFTNQKALDRYLGAAVKDEKLGSIGEPSIDAVFVEHPVGQPRPARTRLSSYILRRATQKVREQAEESILRSVRTGRMSSAHPNLSAGSAPRAEEEYQAILDEGPASPGYVAADQAEAAFKKGREFPSVTEAEIAAAVPVPLSEERIAEMVQFATSGDAEILDGDGADAPARASHPWAVGRNDKEQFLNPWNERTFQARFKTHDDGATYISHLPDQPGVERGEFYLDGPGEDDADTEGPGSPGYVTADRAEELAFRKRRERDGERLLNMESGPKLILRFAESGLERPVGRAQLEWLPRRGGEIFRRCTFTFTDPLPSIVGIENLRHRAILQGQPGGTMHLANGIIQSQIAPDRRALDFQITAGMFDALKRKFDWEPADDKPSIDAHYRQPPVRGEDDGN